jgi:CHAD domain-containing protein
MATVTTWADARPYPHLPPRPVPHAGRQANDEHRGLRYSMDRVLKELENLREFAKEAARDAARETARNAHTSQKTSQHHDNDESVHDLRVSIRRCRSVAAVMEEVDPHPAWPEMRQAARKLFRGLGGLRDAQVMENWVAKLAPDDDPIAAQLLAGFGVRESPLLQDALRAARKFNEKDWRRLERVLRQRSRLVPPGSPAAECLVLERFEAAKEFHARALRTETSQPWHTLRIYMKRFRYTVENLLPEHHVQWQENLKRVQDLLGDVHDLDVLSEAVKSATPENSSVEEFDASRRTWRERLARERSERITTYRQLTLGSTSLWNAWRRALPHGEALQAAALARLRATARASDVRQHRTMRTARIAKSLFRVLSRALRRGKADPVFADPRAHQLLFVAAILQNVRNGRARKSPQPKSSQKAAFKFLRSLDIPAGFTAGDWAIVLATVRYHRGAEPQEKSSVFSKLSADQQNTVRALAGVLRLARAVRKSGVYTSSHFRAELTPEAMVLRIPGLIDSVETAARLAAAKHLLEVYLAQPVILRPIPVPTSTQIPMPPAPAEPSHLAAASD